MVTAKNKTKGKTSWKGKLPKPDVVETVEVSAKGESKVQWNAIERRKVAICVALYVLDHLDAPRYEALSGGHNVAIQQGLLPVDRQRPGKSVEGDFRLYQEALTIVARYAHPMKIAFENSLKDPDFMIADPYKPVIQQANEEPIVVTREIATEPSIEEMIRRIPTMDLYDAWYKRDREMREMLIHSNPRLNQQDRARSYKDMRHIVRAYGFSDETVAGCQAKAHDIDAVQVSFIKQLERSDVNFVNAKFVLLAPKYASWKKVLENSNVEHKDLKIDVVQDTVVHLQNKLYAIHSIPIR